MVFTYGGDLWKCGLDGGMAVRLTTYPNAESMPRISPDGKQIAFLGSYDGPLALYTMSIDGGQPKRLTYGPAPAAIVGWTADGKIGYASTDQMNFAPILFMVDSKGGQPVKTSLEEISVGSFSPDGKSVAFNRNNSFTFNWRRYRGGTQGRIGIFNFETKDYSELPTGREQNYFPMWVGDNIYYVSDKVEGTHNLFQYNLKSKKADQLTKFADADIRIPSTDGKTIVFERDGILYRYDIASKAVKAILPRVETDSILIRSSLRKLGNNVSNMALSPSGKRLVVEARGELFSVPARTGETRNMTNSPTDRERLPMWSPDGQSVAYISDATGEYEIYTMPQRGGKAEQLTSGGRFNVQSMRYSPDSKKISFSSKKNELWVLDVATKRATKVFSDLYGNATTYDWAPDGSWIAYVNIGENLQGSIYLYNVRTGKATQVTEGYYSDGSVSFDMNGKYLYFTSARTFNPTPGAFEFALNFTNASRVYAMTLTSDLGNPLARESDEEPETKPKAKSEGGASMSFSMTAGEEEATFQTAPPATPATPAPAAPADEKKSEEKPKELKIDLEGLSDRVFALPWPAGNYVAVVGLNNGVATFNNGQMLMFDFNSRQPATVLEGFTDLSLNQNRTQIAYALGPQIFLGRVAAGNQPGQGRVNTDAVEAMIDPRTEWRQIFNDSWRHYRDTYYDPNMVGVDWNAKRKQYEAYLPYVSNRADLNYVLGMMIGELATGHSYVGGGDSGTLTRPQIPYGLLGADFETVDGKIKIAKIYRGDSYDSGMRGPLTEPGLNVKAGDFLLEIDGQAVNGNMGPHELLQGKAGRTVVLTVNSKPSMDGSRKITVRTVANDGELRYQDWVEANRKLVDKLSGGRIGYLHVPNTSQEGMIGFIKGYYSQSDKEAILIDERYNGGGMIPTYFFEKIMRSYQAFGRQRNSGDVGFPVQTLDGPYAMLINEYAGSGGDMFPWLFKRNKIGPLIGTRTWGGLVGITSPAPLVDGGFIYAPEFGIYDQTTGKWIAENTGVDPDIKVDLTPRDRALGQDPQIAKGVEYLLKEIAKRGKPVRKRPDFPNTTKVSN